MSQKKRDTRESHPPGGAGDGAPPEAQGPEKERRASAVGAPDGEERAQDDTPTAREARIARGRHPAHRGGRRDGPYTDRRGLRHPGARETAMQIVALNQAQQADIDELAAGVVALQAMGTQPDTAAERAQAESHLRALDARIELREAAIIRRLRARELIEIAGTLDGEALARATHARVLQLLKLDPIMIPERAEPTKPAKGETGSRLGSLADLARPRRVTG